MWWVPKPWVRTHMHQQSFTSAEEQARAIRFSSLQEVMGDWVWWASAEELTRDWVIALLGKIGFPKIFHTDNEKEFTTKVVLKFLLLWTLGREIEVCLWKCLAKFSGHLPNSLCFFAPTTFSLLFVAAYVVCSISLYILLFHCKQLLRHCSGFLSSQVNAVNESCGPLVTLSTGIARQGTNCNWNS